LTFEIQFFYISAQKNMKYEKGENSKYFPLNQNESVRKVEQTLPEDGKKFESSNRHLKTI